MLLSILRQYLSANSAHASIAVSGPVQGQVGSMLVPTRAISRRRHECVMSIILSGYTENVRFGEDSGHLYAKRHAIEQLRPHRGGSKR